MARDHQRDGASGTRAWTTSRVETVRISFTWTVEQFSKFLTQKKALRVIRSPNFFSDDDEDTQWYLELYPQGREEENDYVSLFLALDCSPQSEVLASYRLSLLTTGGGETHVFREEARFTEGDIRGRDQLISRGTVLDKGKGILLGDALTVQCDISASRVSHSARQRSRLAVSTDDGLSRDLSALLGDLRFSDVTLYVKGREFAAHRVFLSARSPVLASMLDTDSSDRKSNRIHIKDVEPDVFQQVLRYIYTGRIDNLESMAAPLLAVADKYAISGLKNLCEITLIQSMTPANVGSLYMLADVHSAENLKAEAVKLLHKQGGLASMIGPR